MQFTRLRLNGFKSFVDPTDLVIARGLTGIVGPNGCGKSNLLEALRWVMGETRPSQLRGGGMEDVIFAGAASRPARAFAEVQLVIDNADRRAPAAFNDADLLEITRRVTRDLGSGYRVQGREVRARDVQMLFADAGSGAGSPSLVRQGQIAELIAAKPVARRRILEDAAGIAGLSQRRHEAELRLRAAEANLARVDDVIGQLEARLAQLGRQARTAARYREIGTALRRAEALALWRRWEVADAAARVAGAGMDAQRGAVVQAEARATAAALARARADAALPALREEEAVAGAVVQRLVIARAALAEEIRQTGARIAVLEARLVRLDEDAAREGALGADAEGVLARLARDAAALDAAGAGHEDRAAQAGAAAEAARAALDACEAVQLRLAGEAAEMAARHQEATRALDGCRRAAAQAAQALEAARRAAGAATGEAARAAGAEDAARAELSQAGATAANSDALLAKAEAARLDAATREAATRATLAEADGAARALQAEVAGLARLVTDRTGDSGQMLAQVTVAPGYERALGAALGDDLRHPAEPAAGGSGWVVTGGAAAALPDGVVPLSAHVTAPAALARRLAFIGVIDDAQGAALQARLVPGQRLVSRAGDLWRWDGLRVMAADAPSATALRFEQANRLAALRRDRDGAEAAAGAARAAHEAAAARLQALAKADTTAREARRAAERLLADADRRLRQAEVARQLAEGRGEAAALAVTQAAAADDAARAALAGAEATLAALPDPGAAREAAARARAEVGAAREAMLAARAAEDDLRRQAEGRRRRAEAITRERAQWHERQLSAGARIAGLAARRAETGDELARLRDAPAALAEREAVLARDIAREEARRTAATDALAAGEAALRTAQAAERDTERAAAEAREARARAEVGAEAASATLDEAAARIAEAHGCTPQALLDALAVGPDDIPALAALEAEIADLRRKRDALGPVNLRAEEDAAEATAERDLLATEKLDLDEAIRALRGGIGSLNREGRERLLAAFARVNENFSTLFRHLFGGGEAELQLVESDDPLQAGLEIMCQPPGKKLAALSLMSGGEQTLTALALIFAVFLANPAPVCVLDEVDAPLDDANVTRFCDLLDEMTRRTETRFLVITHHAVTMARMDRLFGVTMAEPGVSQLVSVDLRRAEALVA
ncbi:MAG: AAA family ATPase [Rubellimicrobium sp.]|nr:AAA family ATPase [Rubellimicrobium sp.]